VKKTPSLPLPGQLAASVWVFFLTQQTCLNSRIADQLIIHAFLSVPLRTYMVGKSVSGLMTIVSSEAHKLPGERKQDRFVFDTDICPGI